MVTYDKDIQKNKINYDYDYQMLKINNKTHYGNFDIIIMPCELHHVDDVYDKYHTKKNTYDTK